MCLQCPLPCKLYVNNIIWTSILTASKMNKLQSALCNKSFKYIKKATLTSGNKLDQQQSSFA